MKYKFNTFRKSGGAKYIAGPPLCLKWGGQGPPGHPCSYAYDAIQELWLENSVNHEAPNMRSDMQIYVCSWPI